MAENIANNSAAPSAEPAAASSDGFPSISATEGTEVPRNDDVITLADREKAARLIQRTYRGYRTRRELHGLGLNASARWSEALKEARWHQLYRPSISPAGAGADASKQVHQKWERVVNVAMQAGSDDGRFRNETNSSKLHPASPMATGLCSETAPANASSTPPRSRFRRSFPILHHEVPSQKMAKMMDQRYFLEMVDLKHRHGSNLRKYHNYWKNCPSTQNFFYWLDYGEGKDLDLPECPREKLEHQQVRYLSRDERLNYLVTVDQAGLFRWAKNNELVCTDSTRFKDSLKGIVSIDEDAMQFRGHSESGYPVVAYASSSSSISSLSSSDEDSADDSPGEQLNQGYEEAKGINKLVHITPSVMRNHFARKPAKRKDMWLFVADTSFRLYIGIKEKGAFQHSSFLRGARVAAAGLIKIWNGQLRSVTPLSGHYRPPSANFRAFVHALQDQGVDMSHVSITKSYAILAGMEGYTRTKHKLRALHETLDDSKEKLLHGRQNNRHVGTDAQVSDEKAIHKDQTECSATAVNKERLSVNDKESDGRDLPARLKIHQTSASQDSTGPSDEPATMPDDV
ncbi:IQ calmodulin-binding motif protein [Aspergillus thermomutatus]|uniref:IQ domain-containing protein IQM6 n=1 Tax=Aspergillus thermomutatus TaxID=41047 RepID=A0A397HJH1_ASPTH|nr:uncharacterized protein CDV56_107839 [Aspergillus thermomutatus]RHZ63235.1 hypothetical protein CDV56_107839 [Aspergillus thermomutatus]